MRQSKLLEESSPLSCLVRRKGASFDVKCASVGFFRTSLFTFPVPLLATLVEKNPDKIKNKMKKSGSTFKTKPYGKGTGIPQRANDYFVVTN